MFPFVANGQAWKVYSVDPGDDRLVDRTGRPKLATTDPATMTINVSREVAPPLLDKVVLHEVAHAMSVSHDLLAPLRAVVPNDLWVFVEEWNASFMENYGIEATIAASEVLGRPLCIRGYCTS